MRPSRQLLSGPIDVMCPSEEDSVDPEHEETGDDAEMQEAPEGLDTAGLEKGAEQYDAAILDPLLTPVLTPPPPTALLVAAFSLLTLEEL